MKRGRTFQERRKRTSHAPWRNMRNEIVYVWDSKVKIFIAINIKMTILKTVRFLICNRNISSDIALYSKKKESFSSHKMLIFEALPESSIWNLGHTYLLPNVYRIRLV